MLSSVFIVSCVGKFAQFKPLLPSLACSYIVVIQDCRGRYKSEGRFSKYTSEGDDGVDTMEWICAQPWCNGKVWECVGMCEMCKCAKQRPPLYLPRWDASD